MCLSFNPVAFLKVIYVFSENFCQAQLWFHMRSSVYLTLAGFPLLAFPTVVPQEKLFVSHSSRFPSISISNSSGSIVPFSKIREGIY